MLRVGSVFALVGLVLLVAACGSGAEADLDRSESELREKAKGMDKGELEAAIEDLKGLMEDVEADGRDLGPEDTEEAQELLGRVMKIGQVMAIYQQELASRK